jgi:hypothetical protein
MVLNPFLVILIPLASEMTLWTHSNEETRSDAGGHKSSSAAPGYRRETLANPGQPRRQETAGAPTRPSWVSAAGRHHQQPSDQAWHRLAGVGRVDDG